MTSFRSERGQALALTTIFIASLLGMAALVVDVGSWFRAQRDTQRIADAAALAGAQALPDDAGKAHALAVEYTSKNDGASPAISFSTKHVANDTIRVEVRRDAPGLFAQIFRVDSVNVGGKATARASYPSAARWVAPIVVHEKHPMLMCKPRPCFDVATEIPLHHLHDPGGGDASGSFGLISLNDDDVNANTLAQWLQSGFDGYMRLGDYRSAPSSNFNNGQFQSALADRMNTELLFPIYRKIVGSGSTARYEVIGWVGFVVTHTTGGGSNVKLHGHFTRVVWEGIAGTSAPATDYGVRSIELVE